MSRVVSWCKLVLFTVSDSWKHDHYYYGVRDKSRICRVAFTWSDAWKWDGWVDYAAMAWIHNWKGWRWEKLAYHSHTLGVGVSWNNSGGSSMTVEYAGTHNFVQAYNKSPELFPLILLAGRNLGVYSLPLALWHVWILICLILFMGKINMINLLVSMLTHFKLHSPQKLLCAWKTFVYLSKLSTCPFRSPLTLACFLSLAPPHYFVSRYSATSPCLTPTPVFLCLLKCIFPS